MAAPRSPPPSNAAQSMQHMLQRSQYMVEGKWEARRSDVPLHSSSSTPLIMDQQTNKHCEPQKVAFIF